MNTALQGWGIWLALAGACIGTYLCRAIGVLLSGKINQESEIFQWISAITYAKVAALTVRMSILPLGLLATVPVYLRIGLCLLSFAVMISKPQRRLVPALLTGTLLLMTYGLIV
jgi:hypothetical protein